MLSTVSCDGAHSCLQGPIRGHLTLTALAGVGIYILFDNGAEVDLLYELEIPHYPHEAQEQLGIYKTGEFTIQVKVRLCLYFVSKSHGMAS